MVNLEQFRGRYLNAATFAQRAFKEIESLPANDFWLRPGEVGRLIQEVLPLAMVAKYLDIPGRRVRCRHLGRSSDKCDGELTIKGEWVNSGWLDQHINVEVTSAQFKNQHLLREALARYGSVFDDPDIIRIGSRMRGNDQIVSHAVAKDGDQEVKDVLHWIKGAVDKKVKKSYPRPCFLVVAIEPGRPLSLSEWLSVVKDFPREVAKRGFDSTFLVHTGVGEIHQAC